MSEGGSDLGRRLDRLEKADDKIHEKLNKLSELIVQQSQLVEIHSNLAPEVQQLRIDLSNAKLVQKGFIWVVGATGTSAIAIALAFLAERLL
jgi:hypothetical protein